MFWFFLVSPSIKFAFDILKVPRGTRCPFFVPRSSKAQQEDEMVSLWFQDFKTLKLVIHVLRLFQNLWAKKHVLVLSGFSFLSSTAPLLLLKIMNLSSDPFPGAMNQNSWVRRMLSFRFQGFKSALLHVLRLAQIIWTKATCSGSLWSLPLSLSNKPGSNTPKLRLTTSGSFSDQMTLTLLRNLSSPLFDSKTSRPREWRTTAPCYASLPQMTVQHCHVLVLCGFSFSTKADFNTSKARSGNPMVSPSKHPQIATKTTHVLVWLHNFKIQKITTIFSMLCVFVSNERPHQPMSVFWVLPLYELNSERFKMQNPQKDVLSDQMAPKHEYSCSWSFSAWMTFKTGWENADVFGLCPKCTTCQSMFSFLAPRSPNESRPSISQNGQIQSQLRYFPILFWLRANPMFSLLASIRNQLSRFKDQGYGDVVRFYLEQHRRHTMLCVWALQKSSILYT